MQAYCEAMFYHLPSSNYLNISEHTIAVVAAILKYSQSMYLPSRHLIKN